MERSVLHVDMNCFYAGVEMAERPELRGRPVIVGGDEGSRHGIVLTKSIEAKRYGIKTAEALWEARAKCPDLVVLPPRYRLYRRYSELARAIYYQYSDLVEPFGLDEAWRLGQGEFRKRFGEKKVFDIMLKHVERLSDMCRKIGVDAEMWSDMWFRAASKTGDYYDLGAKCPPKIAAQIPDNFDPLASALREEAIAERTTSNMEDEEEEE